MSPTKSPPAKKRSYKLPEKTKELLDADTINTKLWSEVTSGLQDYPVSVSYKPFVIILIVLLMIVKDILTDLITKIKLLLCE